jgi:hypothetical protein
MRTAWYLLLLHLTLPKMVLATTDRIVPLLSWQGDKYRYTTSILVRNDAGVSIDCQIRQGDSLYRSSVNPRTVQPFTVPESSVVTALAQVFCTGTPQI